MIFAHFHKGGQDYYFIGRCLDDIYQYVEKHGGMTRANFIKTLTEQEARAMKFPHFNTKLKTFKKEQQAFNLDSPSVTVNHRQRDKLRPTHA